MHRGRFVDPVPPTPRNGGRCIRSFFYWRYKMARARNIKPGFFSNDDLVELPFEARLLFIGLWTIADRSGRLLDRPKKIKMDIFPGDSVDCDAMLSLLAKSGFIRRYETSGHRAIQVVNWDKHQNPHVKEVPSTIPAPCERITDPVPAPDEHHARTVQDQPFPERAGLIPDSLNLIPDSGYPIPDSLELIPDTFQEQPLAVAAPRRKPAPKQDEPNPFNLLTWQAYKQAYTERYGVPPIRDTATNTKIKSVVKGLGEEAPHVAAFFVRHNGARYVAGMHQIGYLLTDYAKLRTEWATNSQMTQAKARQADNTATNLDAFGPLIAAAKAREAAGEN